MSGIITDYKNFFKEMPKNIVLFFGIVLFATIVSASYDVLFGIYMKNIGYTEEAVGKVISLKTFGIAFGAVPLSVFAKRFNKKYALVLGLIIMLISSMGILNFKSLILIEMCSFMFGIGHATLMILQGPLIFESIPSERRVMAFSMVFVFQNIAFVIGSLVLGNISDYLSRIYDSSSANYMVLSGATYLLVVGLVLSYKIKDFSLSKSIKRNPIIDDFKHVYNGYKKLMSGRTLMYFMQVSLVGVGAGMIVPFFSVYLKYTLGISDGVVGNIMAISQVGTIIGGLSVPILSRKYGEVKTVIICQMMSIPFLLSISLPQGVVIMTISFFFRSSLMNMASPIINSLALQIVDEEDRTNMSGLQSMINNIFRGLGIYIGGFIMYRVGYNMPYYLTIVCYLIGTYILYTVFSKRKQLPEVSQVN